MALIKKIKDFKETGIITNPFLDTIFFRKIRSILGGKMHFMLVGAVPIDHWIIFTSAFY